MCTTTPRGPFPLAETTRLAYIDRDPDGDGPELRLGFGRDHTWEPTGVTVTVTQRGTAVTVDGDRAARLLVERILGLDVDATSFADAGTRDPVIGRLQAEAPGLRPPQIHSAYEAAVSASWLPGDPRPKPGACARPSRSTPEPSRTSQDAR